MQHSSPGPNLTTADAAHAPVSRPSIPPQYPAPLGQCVMNEVFSIVEDKRLMEDHKQEVDSLQRKVSELQAEYKVEMKKSRDFTEVRHVVNASISLCCYMNSLYFMLMH